MLKALYFKLCSIGVRSILIAFLVCLLSSGCATRYGFSFHKMSLQEENDIEDYTVRTFYDLKHGGVLEIAKGNVLICRRVSPNGGFYMGGVSEECDEVGRRLFLRPGTDITGEGKLTVVITEWSEKPVNNFRDYILELDDKVHLLALINSGTYPLVYSDVDGKGIYEILMDLSYSMVSADHTTLGKDKTPVIFKYTNGVFQVSSTTLKDTDMNKLCPTFKDSFLPSQNGGTCVTDAFNNKIILLLTLGNKVGAYGCINEAWPKMNKSKKQYIAFLKSTTTPNIYASGTAFNSNHVPR